MYGSHATAPLSEEYDPVQKHRRVRIMPNAIDTEKYSYSEKKRREGRQELKIPQGATVFGISEDSARRRIRDFSSIYSVRY